MTNNSSKSSKKMVIEGMSCGHCTDRVEKALNAIDGISAKVTLDDNTATLSLAKDILDEVLINAVTEAGYTVVDMQ